jgi:DNA repair protein RecN (Recombination protein N)
MSAHLVSLRIKNLALVEELAWRPGRGFNAISGETGAGKSVLLGALNLLLGERADKSLIRTGAESCAIEAVFESRETRIYDALFEEAGVEPCQEGQLLLKRSITPTGSRQFINGSACTLGLLKSLGDLLVDLHGPHEHQSLFSRERQTQILDDFAGLRVLREGYVRARRMWLDLRAEAEALADEAGQAVRELELIRHQLEEIDGAELVDAGEEEELTQRQRVVENSRRLLELGGQAAGLLDEGEYSLSSQCGDLGRLLREIARLDPAAAALESEQIALHETLSSLSRGLADYLEKIEDEPEARVAIAERLDLIQGLKRKYGAGIAEVLAFAEERRERLGRLERREERGANLSGEIARAEEAMGKLARELSAGRKKGAGSLAKSVAGQLSELGFRQAGFEIQLEALAEPGAHGMELAEFVFAPNPGEAPRPLRQIASSGEISRVMLALKCALAEQDEVSLLVFDEIDANVGGETATRVGEKMRQLGEKRQVLCISHLPQVVAAASTHFCVEKEVREGRTQSSLREVVGVEREEEIARMLGGREASALEHARHLLSVPAGSTRSKKSKRSQ